MTINGKTFDTVQTMGEAWALADELFPSDYIEDAASSARAGYPVFRSTAAGCNAYICDLGDRLELNFDNGGSFNIWVQPQPLKLAALVPLKSKITVYVPSTVNVNEATDNSAQVERVARFLSEAFGGATASPVAGYWVAADKSLVTEHTTMVFAYCSTEQAERYIDDVVRLCYDLKVEMGQEAIALEYNGGMYFI